MQIYVKVKHLARHLFIYQTRAIIGASLKNPRGKAFKIEITLILT